MKAKRWMGWLLALLVAATSTMMLAGCDDDDDDDDAAPPAGGGGTGGGGTGGGGGGTGGGGTGGGGGGTGGGGTGGGGTTPADVNVAGVWNGTRSSSGGSANIQFFFNQAANGTLTGQYQDTSGFSGNLTGEIDGDDIQLVITLTAGSPGETWTFTGAANATGTQLAGGMNTGAGVHNISAHR